MLTREARVAISKSHFLRDCLMPFDGCMCDAPDKMADCWRTHVRNHSCFPKVAAIRNIKTGKEKGQTKYCVAKALLAEKAENANKRGSAVWYPGKDLNLQPID